MRKREGHGGKVRMGCACSLSQGPVGADGSSLGAYRAGISGPVVPLFKGPHQLARQ